MEILGSRVCKTLPDFISFLSLCARSYYWVRMFINARKIIYFHFENYSGNMQELELLPLILSHQTFFQNFLELVPRDISPHCSVESSEIKLISGPPHAGKTSFLFRFINRFCFPTTCTYKILFFHIRGVNIQAAASFPFMQPYKA